MARICTGGGGGGSNEFLLFALATGFFMWTMFCWRSFQPCFCVNDWNKTQYKGNARPLFIFFSPSCYSFVTFWLLGNVRSLTAWQGHDGVLSTWLKRNKLAPISTDSPMIDYPPAGCLHVGLYNSYQVLWLDCKTWESLEMLKGNTLNWRSHSAPFFSRSP